MHDLKTRGLEHFLRGFFHVGCHLVLVVAEFVMKTQRGNAPFVFYDGIEVHVIFVTRQDFTEGAHADVGPLILANFFLERSTETVGIGAVRKHHAAAATFKSVAADEVGVLLRKVSETRQVKAAGTAVVESRWFANEIFGATRDAWAHDVFAEVVAHVSAGVCQAVRVQPGFGEQEKARGLERGSGHNDNLGLDGVILLRFRIDEVNAAGFAGLRIDDDFTDDGIGAQRKVAGVHRGVNQAGWRVEGGMDVATTLTLTGAAAIATAAIFVVLEAVGGDPGAVYCVRTRPIFRRLSGGHFGAVQLGGTLENAVGRLRRFSLTPVTPDRDRPCRSRERYRYS